MNMRKAFVAALCGLCPCGVVVAGEIQSRLVGTIRYDEAEGWRITSRVESLPDGREKLHVAFDSETPRQPPRTSFKFRFPLRDAVGDRKSVV